MTQDPWRSIIFLSAGPASILGGGEEGERGQVNYCQSRRIAAWIPDSLTVVGRRRRGSGCQNKRRRVENRDQATPFCRSSRALAASLTAVSRHRWKVLRGRKLILLRPRLSSTDSTIIYAFLFAPFPLDFVTPLVYFSYLLPLTPCFLFRVKTRLLILIDVYFHLFFFILIGRLLTIC